MKYIAMDEYGGCSSETRADTLAECIEKAINVYGSKSLPETEASLIAKGLSFLEYKAVLGWMAK